MRLDVGDGVQFAIGPDGRVADPAVAPPLDREYRCFVCGGFVHVKRGAVRAAHFAYYAKPEIACNGETVLHEAAKLRIVEMLNDGTAAFYVAQECGGYTDASKQRVCCHVSSTRTLRIEVPAFDGAAAEVPFHGYRLDAAARSGDGVVFGFEVFQSHAVDPVKQAALDASGLRWIEVPAESVMAHRMPWPLVRGSVGLYKCEACEKEEQAVAQRLAAREEARRARAEADRRLEAQRQLALREAPLARQGRRVVKIWGRKPGERYGCLVCNKPLTVEFLDDRLRFMHPEGVQCDARRVWVRAAMLAVYNQLQDNPDAIRVKRYCSTKWPGICTGVVVDRLPAFDRVHGVEPSLHLVKGDRVVLQVVLGRQPQLVGAPVMSLVPNKAISHPAVWWQQKDGRLCDDCQRRTGEDNDVPEKSESGADVRHRIAWATAFANLQLNTMNVNLALASGLGVHVCRCGACGEFTVCVATQGLRRVPTGLRALLSEETHAGGATDVVNRCIRCGEIVRWESAAEVTPIHKLDRSPLGP